jgi:hypothetical protein
MGQKRTPALVSKAKQLRADGRSFAEVAAELSKGGRSVSKAAVMGWLKESSPAESVSVPPSPPVSLPQPVPLDRSPMAPEDLTGLLTGLLRQQQELAGKLSAAGDHQAAQRTIRVSAQLATLLQKQQARDDDDGDVLRVRAADVAAAGERARSKLHDLVSRLAEERGR